MSPINCPFCEELSAPGAKFCSACGGALYLAPCLRCGAVNDVSAATCYQCRGQLAGRNADALDVVVPAIDTSMRRRYRVPQVSITVAILAAIGALAYYGLAQRVPVDAPPSVATASEASAIKLDAGARATAEPPLTLPQEPAKEVREAASPSRVDRRSVESPKPRPAAVATTGSQARTAVKELERRVPSPVACTEQVAALGLCPPESVQVKQLETASVRKAPIASTKAIDAGKVAAQKSAPQEACTEAVAALGLCAPGFTQRRE